MKIIKYLLITIIIFSCEENNLTKWVNYDESSELIESQENDNRRLRYQRIQSISKDKNQLIDGFEKEISKFIKNKYESYKELILERSIPEIQKNVIEGKLSYYDLLSKHKVRRQPFGVKPLATLERNPLYFNSKVETIYVFQALLLIIIILVIIII